MYFYPGVISISRGVAVETEAAKWCSGSLRGELLAQVWMEVKSTTSYGDKRKARVGYPPGSRNARFFQSHLAEPRSVDFPPEINRETIWLGFLARSSFGAEAPQNKAKLLENQDTESFLKSRLRPTGLKTGHKRRFPV